MRTTLGIIIGIIMAAGVLYGCGYGFMRLHPFPADIDWLSPRKVSEYVMSAPNEAKALLVATWALAALVGGWIAARIARLHRGGAALTIATPLMLIVIVSAALIPQDPWMPVLGMLLPIPFALAAWRLAIPRREL